MGYAENGGGEERSTWKLCGGVKLQRPARCLPFAGDIRNSSVVTAPNRGVDPLDRCIHRGRGLSSAQRFGPLGTAYNL